MMTLNQILAQIAAARQAMVELAKLYPDCFDKNGKPIVAELRLAASKTQTPGSSNPYE